MQALEHANGTSCIGVVIADLYTQDKPPHEEPVTRKLARTKLCSCGPHFAAKVVRGRTTFGSQKVVRVAKTDPGVETAHCFVTVGYYLGANDKNTSRVNVVRPWFARGWCDRCACRKPLVALYGIGDRTYG